MIRRTSKVEAGDAVSTQNHFKCLSAMVPGVRRQKLPMLRAAFSVFSQENNNPLMTTIHRVKTNPHFSNFAVYVLIQLWLTLSLQMDGDIGIILTSVLDTGERVLLQLEILKSRITVSSDMPGSTVLSFSPLPVNTGKHTTWCGRKRGLAIELKIIAPQCKMRVMLDSLFCTKTLHLFLYWKRSARERLKASTVWLILYICDVCQKSFLSDRGKSLLLPPLPRWISTEMDLPGLMSVMPLFICFLPGPLLRGERGLPWSACTAFFLLRISFIEFLSKRII